MVKAVLDSNVFISGLLTDGVCRLIFKSFIEKKFHLIISPSIFEEFLTVLRRPKFTNLITKEDIQELTVLLELNAVFVNPKIIATECRDPSDNHLLTAAIASNADFLVTRDKDLLVLDPFLNISIITPSNFLKAL